jgi:hypothetical protein
LLQSVFGADADAAAKAIDEDSAELFKAVGETVNEKSNETLPEETEQRKEQLKAGLIKAANQSKVKSNVKSPVKMSFSNEAVEIEGAIDPKNPNPTAGSKTYMDEPGNEMTIRRSLRSCH